MRSFCSLKTVNDHPECDNKIKKLLTNAKGINSLTTVVGKLFCSNSVDHIIQIYIYVMYKNKYMDNFKYLKFCLLVSSFLLFCTI